MAVETKRSFCRFCHASCAMVVEVENDKVVSVRGDKEDHLFHGYTCVKGRQLPDMHNLPDRMITSKIRQPDGSFRDIATADALKLAGERMKQMVEESRTASPSIAAPMPSRTARCSAHPMPLPKVSVRATGIPA